MTEFLASSTARARQLFAGFAKHRRRVAIEAGETTANILLTRREASGLSVEKLITIDLVADGLLTPEEMARRLGQILAGFPESPAGLSLPLGRSHSQIIDLAPGDTGAARDFVQTIGGSQFDQVPSVFDTRPMRPYGGHAHPAWITIAREADVELQILRCGLTSPRVSHVVSADAALAAAFAEAPGHPPSAVLVEIGVVSSTLVLVSEGQIVFSAGIDTGTGALFAALAADLGYSAEGAETVLRRHGPAAVTASTPRLQAALQRWRQSVETLLREHARESAIPFEHLLTLPRWFSGTLLAEPGVRALFEASVGGDAAQRWPDIAVGGGGRTIPLAACAIAYGVAVIASGLQPSFADLLPPASREWRRLRHRTAWLHAACLACLLGGLAFAAYAGFSRLASVRAKEARITLLAQAHAAAPRVARETAALEQAGVEATPVLYLQKRTRDFLMGLRALSTVRTSHKTSDFWLVLVADSETYAARALPAAGAVSEPLLLRANLARPTGLVVELSLPPANKDHLGTIGDLAQKLRAAGQFNSVDILPMQSRQPMADLTVFAPAGGAFVLALDTAPFEHNLPAVPSRLSAQQRAAARSAELPQP